MLKNTQDDTKSRLLRAGGEIFSRKGYRAATVREICRRARVNLAAVNYHFSGKQNLYEAVFLEAHEKSLREHPPDMGLSPESPAGERLYAYVLSFMRRILGEGSQGAYGRLLAREAFEPSGSLDRLVSQALLPLAAILRGIIEELLGAAADEQTVKLCLQSVIGQCLHYFRARPIIERVTPQFRYDNQGVQSIARHITDFTLAGLQVYALGPDSQA